MKKLAVIIGTVVAVCGCSPHKAGQVSGDGFTSLFDGKTLSNWHGYGHGDIKGRWKAEDGALVLDTSVELSHVNGNLVSNEEYENFDLKLDWKISKNGNSGVLFLVHEDSAKFHEPYFTGPEMQVLDNDGHPDGKIIKHRAGDLYDLISCSTETVKPVGEWNHAEIIINNGNLQLFLNGTNVVTTTLWNDTWKTAVAASKFKAWPAFATYKKGAIVLQDHGDMVSFKNIMIRKL